MRRQHPAALIGYTSKNFWLLLIPLIRGFISLPSDVTLLRTDPDRWTADFLKGFQKWVEGAGWDILTVAVMIALAAVRWYFTFYSVTDKGVRVRSGMIFKRDIYIPAESISAVTGEENPIYARFGGVRVYIDTDAASGKRTDADVSLMIYKADMAKLFNILSAAFTKPDKRARKRDRAAEGMNYTYKVPPLSLIAFSLLFSSALSGVILLTTALSGSADIIGDKLENDFIKAVSDVSDAVSEFMGRIISGISPAGIGVSIVILIGFLISFVSNMIRHINFTVTRRGRCIFISSGLIVKRKYCINSRKINIADMRQNLLMKLFGVTSVHVNCTGYGKRRNEYPVFVPVCSVKHAYGTGGKKGKAEKRGVMNMLLSGFSMSESFISPKVTYILRFIMPPALLIYAILCLSLLAVMVFPHWLELIRFMTFLCEIPAVWLLLVKACAYCTNGINITSDSVCAKYCVWYDFHTITVPLERVAEIRLTQTVFQRMNRSCDVHIFTNSEHIGSHCVRCMPINEIQELIRERF